MLGLTEKAISEIKRLRTEDKPLLRVQVLAGGCRGLSWRLTFTSDKLSHDQVQDDQGVDIIYDPKSRIYITGATLDFSDGLNGKGFELTNPKAKACGCGSSFSI